MTENKISIRDLCNVFILCLLLTLLGCENERASDKAEELSMSFEEELVIGDNKNNPDGPLFSSPKEIRTDNRGNIYVSDQRNANIQVFDSDGKFLRSIGQSGKGPGEFGNINAFDINNRNEIVVFDAVNQRITRLSTTANILDAYTPEQGAMTWPQYARALGKDQYLLLHKTRFMDGEGESKRNLYSSLLHLYSNKFDNRMASFGRVDSLMNTDNEFLRQYVRLFNGYFCITNNSEVWFVPKIYDGRLFKFSKSPGGWDVSNTLKGNVFPQQPVVEDASPNTDGAFVINTYKEGQRQKMAGKINSESLGLFQLSDGRLIHFSCQLRDGKRNTYIELFSSEGELEGYGRLNEFTFPGTETGASIKSVWKDENDRFYFIDNRDIPLVRIGKIRGI